MKAFFDDFAAETRKLSPEKADCGDCRQCCESPPFLMTTSDLEFLIIKRYMEENRLHHRVHFIPLTGDTLDKRESYLFWQCPFYSRLNHCEIYPVRPFACRIVGPLVQEPIKHCVYKNPRIYSIPPEIPLWDSYAAILRQYDFRRGYIFPDQVIFNAPALELLMGYRLPWSRWRALPL